MKYTHASFVGDDRVRYSLTREWKNGPTLIAAGLNPSRAGIEDDPTVRKWVGFADRLGFGGLIVINPIPYRATDPGDLRGMVVDQEVMETNRWAIKKVLQRQTPGMLLCSWGGGVPAEFRIALDGLVRTAQTWAAELVALRVNKDGTPCHPLYLPYSCELRSYEHKFQ